MIMETNFKRTGRIIALAAAMLFAAGLFMLLASEPACAASKPLAGKRVLVEGDSIQEGFGKYIETGAKSMGTKKVRNQARNASTLAVGRLKRNSSWWRVSRMSYAEIRKYNYIIITTGTNDYYNFYKVHPGTAKSTNVKTTGGALNNMIRRIQKASPKTKIVIVTPIHRFSGRKNCDKKKNRYGKTLADYRKVITEVAARYDNVYVIRGTDITRANEMCKRSYSLDGLHPRKGYAQRTLARRFKNLFVKRVVNQPAA